MAHFKTLCGDCHTYTEKDFAARPLVCYHCGSDFLAVKEITGPSGDVVARVRKLANDGMSWETLQKSFDLSAETLAAILQGDYGEGEFTPHYVSVTDRMSRWIDDMRKKKVLP